MKRGEKKLEFGKYLYKVKANNARDYKRGN